MLKKRGQITVFIIIGIFILAFLGVILYFRHEIAIEEPEEVVPEELMPVKLYIEDCLHSTVKDGVAILGMQGGYIYLPDRIRHDPTSYISMGGAKVPYWFYRGRSRVPTIPGMEQEIDQYVEENIMGCIADFSALSDSFNITRTGNITVDSSISDNKVVADMEFPLRVRLRGSEGASTMSRFTSELSISMKRVYNLAKEIMVSENNQAFLEKMTIDLMTAGKDIPFTDILFECGQKQWYLPDIEEDIKNLLYYNIPKIRIKGTDHVPFQEHSSKYELLRAYTPQDIGKGITPEDTPEDAYEYFHFFWDAATRDYKDLRANVNYQKGWSFEIHARPGRGDVLESSWGKGSPQYYLSFLCINAYHFTYDVIYPVEIRVTDPSAFGGEGYTFRYATPVLINHNKPDRSDFPIELYEYPEGIGGEFCDERLDREIAVYAKDKKTMEDIPGVNITFNCMNVYYCGLGKTGFELGVNRLSTRLPSFCSPARLEADHRNYAKTTKTVSPEATYTDILMTPLKEMNFEVVKRRLTGPDLQQPQQLEPNETAIIHLQTDQLEDFSIFRRYPPESDDPEKFRSIKLPDDDIKYRLDITLLSRKGKIIGGFRGNWTVDDSQLKGKSSITFTALEKIPHPRSTKEMAGMITMLEEGAYNTRLMPSFS